MGIALVTRREDVEGVLDVGHGRGGRRTMRTGEREGGDVIYLGGGIEDILGRATSLLCVWVTA